MGSRIISLHEAAARYEIPASWLVDETLAGRLSALRVGPGSRVLFDGRRLELQLLARAAGEAPDSHHEAEKAHRDLEIKSFLGRGDELEDDPDKVPEKPEVPVSRPGDLWLLGKHRVLCGDSTSAECVTRLLNGEEPRLMVTDPPYGVEYDPDWRNRAGVSSTKRTGKVANDDRVDWTEVWKLVPCDVSYVWHAAAHGGEVAANLHIAGFEIRSQIIWAKSRFALSRGNYHWQHEPCWYAVRNGRKAHWIGDRSQSTVWSITVTDDGDKNTHGTQKPLECMGRPMRNHDAPLVFDPFLGSGNTLVAAHLQGRTCYGIDLDAGYVDVAVRRWQRHSGQPATLDGDGRTFEMVSKERLKAPP